MKLGAFDYLTKPFENREIRRVAREALASRAGGPIPVTVESREGKGTRFSIFLPAMAPEQVLARAE